MNPAEHKILTKTDEIFNILETLGCRRTNMLGMEQIQFHRKPSIQLNPSQVAQFARAIRAATHLETKGVLIADVDLKGKVIGWHKKNTAI